MSEERKPYGRRRKPEDRSEGAPDAWRWFTRTGEMQYCPNGASPEDGSWEDAIHAELVKRADSVASHCCAGESTYGFHLYAFPSEDPGRPGYDLWVMGVLSRRYRQVPFPGELALRVAIARHFEWFATVNGHPWKELQISARDTEMGSATWTVAALHG